jgi:predicted XRE-type DNA-binding protein
MTAKRKRHGSSLDDFLGEDGALEQTRAVAIKEVIAWQIEKAMAERELSKAGMAELMKTSRSQLDRLLDPKGANVTIETLQRAATVLGRQLRVELV